MTAQAIPRQTDTASPRGPVLVVAAMREELAALVARFENAQRVELPGRERAWSGTLCGRPIVAAPSGVGARNAARGVSALLERFPADALVGIGVAGGLTPELEPGTLIVAAAVQGGAEGALRLDPAWIERALRVQGAHAGTLVTAERVLGTAADKAALRAAFDVSGPAAVDMETAAWAGAAARHGVACVFARAVCDTASDDLPLDLEGCRDETGEIRRARVAGSLLWNPSAAPALWELRRRLRACSMVLAGFVEDLLQ